MSAVLTPFTIVALAPFCPTPDADVSPTLVEVDPSEPDKALQEMGPRLRIQMPKDLCPGGEVTVEISSMRDFLPRGLPRAVEYLDRLAQAQAYVAQAAAAGAELASTVGEMQSRWPGLPLDYPDVSASSSGKPSDTHSKVDDILAMVAVDASSAERSGNAGSLHQVAQQAEQISKAVMARIVADHEFRRAEACWQGVRLLLRQGIIPASKNGEQVRLLLAPMSPANLTESLDALLPQLASDLPGLILCDLPFDNTPRGIELLGGLAEFAESLLCPTLAWAGPRLFGVDDWDGFSKLAYLRHHMDDAAFAKFRSLAASSAAGWLGLLTNRMAVRTRHAELDERENLWTAPVWAMATLIAQSLGQTGWSTLFTDYNRFVLQDLAAGTEGAGNMACEVSMGEDRMAQLLECGLTPLVGPLGKDTAFLPKETALDGGSLRHCLLFSRIIGVLLRVQEETADLASTVGSDPAELVRQVLAALFSETGHNVPEDLRVTAGSPGESGLPLDVVFTPPMSVLASEQMGFQFLW